MARRIDRLVGPGHDPRRQIALCHGALHEPRAAGGLRADRDERDAPAVVGAKQLARVVERLGREQVDLPRQREIAEEGGRPDHTGGRPGRSRLLGAGGDPHGLRAGVLEDAAGQMAQPPGGLRRRLGALGLLAIAAGLGRRRSLDGDECRRVLDAEAREIGRRSSGIRRGIRVGRRGVRTAWRAHVLVGPGETNRRCGEPGCVELHGAAGRAPVSPRVHAQHVGSQRQAAELVAPVGSGGRHRRGPADHRHHGPGDGNLVRVEHTSLDAAEREGPVRGGLKALRASGRRAPPADNQHDDCRRESGTVHREPRRGWTGPAGAAPVPSLDYGVTVNGTSLVIDSFLILSLTLICTL